MKRKVGLFLLTVLVAGSLGATLVASLAMYRLVSGLQDEDLRRIETSLGERFDVFETMLRSENKRNIAAMAQVLPQIDADVASLGRPPADLAVEQLNAMVAKYGVENIYFINRDHTVFNTNLATDRGLVFAKESFTEFLDSVFDKGKVISDAVDLSSRVESLTKVYRVVMLLSQYTYEHLAHPDAHAIRPVDVVVVRGKTRPVVLFEVFERDPAPVRADKLKTRTPLIDGVAALLRQDTDGARRHFEESLALMPDDLAAQNLLKGCPSDG